MRDSFELATTVPHEERGISMQDEDYPLMGRLEAKTLINQIKRKIGPPPYGAGFRIISCAHDFGHYFDIEVVYDDDDEECVEYMLKAESNIPYKWDEESLIELQQGGYRNP